MNNWYYSLDGQNRVGPISEDDLTKLIAQGNLNRQTLVWQEGMPEWTNASNIDRLFPLNSPPPLPNSSTPSPVSLSKPAVEIPPLSNPTANNYNSNTVPPEIKGWNWGAFFMNVIWGITNSIWISLLCLIPFIGFGVAIYLGIKGNELAWKNGKWTSIQQFKSVQRKWSIAGFIVFPLGLIFNILIIAASSY